MNPPKDMAIAILEDNAPRWEAMHPCLQERFNQQEHVWRCSAPEMIAWLADNLHRTLAISLDHDLEPLPGGPPDPGTGRDVSRWLAQRSPRCPILIHSTNVHAALAMEAELAEAGWKVDRVLPYEDLTWVREAWLPLFQSLIREYAPR